MLNDVFKDGNITPVGLAKLLFDWEPFDYQIAPLNDTSKRIAIRAGRQTGKTTLTAIKGLYSAIWNDGTTTLVISKTQRQAGVLFRKMKQLINISAMKFPQLRLKDQISRETQTVLEFENGSVIYCLPATEDGSNIRGFTAHVIIVDEAAYIKDAVYTAISPMLATTNGRLILIGTPCGVNNFFHRVFVEEDLHFSRYHFLSKQSPLIEPDFLVSEHRKMPMIEYMQEYEAEFMEEADSFYPIKLIDSCMEEDIIQKEQPIKGLDYYLGVDPARHGEDESVFIILEKKPETQSVVWMKEMRDRNLVSLARDIIDLHTVWNFKKILVDETGLGGGLVDILIDNQLPVEGITLSLKGKEEIHNNLKMLMGLGELSLPKNPKLRKQLSELKYEYTKSNLINIYHPSKTGGDDYPTALALAAFGLKTRQAEVIFAFAKKPFFGF